MQLFLQIIGGLCVGSVVLLFILFLLLRIFRGRLARAMEQLGEMAQQGYVPPRIHLEVQNSIEWQDRPAIDQMRSELGELGFQYVGSYTVPEIAALRLTAQAHPTDNVYAVVYEHNQAGIWLDLVSRFVDGTRISHSTAPMGENLDYPAETPVHHFRDLSTAELYRRHLADRPAKDLLPATADDFQRSFEQGYADGMDWRNSRGGSTEQELRRELAARGEEISDEQIAELLEIQRGQAIMGLEHALAERFLAETTLSAARWEEVEDRLVYIFDLLPGSTLAERAYEYAAADDEEEPEEYSLPPDLAHLPAREAFARLNERLPAERRFEKVGELTKPVSADVYAAATLSYDD